MTGLYLIKASQAAFRDVNSLLRRTRPKIELRRHCLKLRYWPRRQSEEESGSVIDLDWSKIRAVADLDLFELRIPEKIGGQDNL